MTSHTATYELHLKCMFARHREDAVVKNDRENFIILHERNHESSGFTFEVF